MPHIYLSDHAFTELAPRQRQEFCEEIECACRKLNSNHLNFLVILAMIEEVPPEQVESFIGDNAHYVRPEETINMEDAEEVLRKIFYGD